MALFDETRLEIMGNQFATMFDIADTANSPPNWPALEADFLSWAAAEWPLWSVPSEADLAAWESLDLAVSQAPEAMVVYLTILTYWIAHKHSEAIA